MKNVWVWGMERQRGLCGGGEMLGSMHPDRCMAWQVSNSKDGTTQS